MKVYTKTGDKGTTGLFSGERVEKDSLRVEAYGTVDEIMSALGLARAFSAQSAVKESILGLQKNLMMLMADVASTNPAHRYVNEASIAALEAEIDRYEALLAPLTNFIVPGATPAAAALDVARTTTRRAERAVIRLARQEAVNPHVQIALNRLSDFCFVLSRVESELTELLF